MRRSKRRAIQQIDRNCAHDNSDAMAPSGIDYVLEVALEVSINASHARVVSPDLLVQKHLHPLPFIALRSRSFERPKQRVEQLPRTCPFQCERSTNDSQRWDLSSENSPGPKRPHHFVIAHVN